MFVANTKCLEESTTCSAAFSNDLTHGNIFVAFSTAIIYSQNVRLNSKSCAAEIDPGFSISDLYFELRSQRSRDHPHCAEMLFRPSRLRKESAFGITLLHILKSSYQDLQTSWSAAA